ncbi:MAG TPA: methylated-DNA--[protein]-cysteine S-methyltransferase [Solirubrobacteraceae bacterium]|jgi:methylated-DNA-[protein]-cysteine S-methyltransferase|nr:methylated-DNA--[protein]-cysteine S-methyltransferase [Solirubrobacteraceae bacterium]
MSTVDSHEMDSIARALRGGGSADASEPGQTRANAARAAARLAEQADSEDLLDIAYAPVDSPFGTLMAAATGRGLVRLTFPEEHTDAVLERLAARVSPRILEAPRRLDPVRRELDEYFTGTRRAFEIPIDWALVGTFARRVLGAAAAIPYGNVLTYTQVAGKAGSPRGSRAAGNALGSNPIPIVVPCHRVLRLGGALGGYAGGLDRKRWLLELEGALRA